MISDVQSLWFEKEEEERANVYFVDFLEVKETQSAATNHDTAACCREEQSKFVWVHAEV